MTDLFTRLSDQFASTAHIGIAGMRDDSDWARQPVRDAAVLMAVTDNREPGLLLTQRPQTMAKHPGQIAFPGGKLEEGESEIEAALREAEEELAVPPSAVRVVGSAKAFVTGTGFRLTPVLGLVPHDIDIAPDPREVDGWFEAPLRFVLDPANHTQKIGNFGGFELPYTEIIWQEHRIWGITAGIIANLSRRLDWRELVD